MKLKVVTTSGKEAWLQAEDAVFGVTPNEALLAQAVRVYLSNQRQGTSKVKTRSEINRTKKKWFRQKGTGNARHGARTPNIFVGGGVSHGPNGMQNWMKDLSKSQKKRSIVCALSKQSSNILISEELATLKGKTKEAHTLLQSIADGARRVLIVLPQTDMMVIRALNNLEKVVVTRADRLNVYEALLAEKIIMSEAAVHALEARFMEKKEVVKAPVAVKEVVKKAPVKKAVKTATKTVTKTVAKPVEKKTPAVKKKTATKTKTVKAKK